MAIGNYSQLKIAAEKYLVYDDISDEFDALLALAESTLNRDIRIREMQSSQAYASQTTQTAILPADFVEAIAFYEQTEAGGVLEFVPSKMFWSSREARAGTNGQPAHYTVLDGTLTLDRTPDTARDYVLEYYAEVTPLAFDQQTNVLLTKAPDVYLWAILYQASIFADNGADTARYSGAYEQAKASLHSSDKRGRLRPGPRIRSRNTRDGAWRIA